MGNTPKPTNDEIFQAAKGYAERATIEPLSPVAVRISSFIAGVEWLEQFVEEKSKKKESKK